MVTADFGPEIELTLFLFMHAKEIAKSLGKCIPIEDLFPYHGLYGSTSCCISHWPCQWERAIFDPPQLGDPLTAFHET